MAKMKSTDDVKPGSNTPVSKKQKASGSGAKGKGAMAGAAKLGAKVIKTAVAMAVAPVNSGEDFEGSQPKPTEVTAPDVVAMVLGWLTDRKEIIIVRDSAGKAVAGVVTYKWLKRHLDKKERRKVVGDDKADKKPGKKSKEASSKRQKTAVSAKAKPAPKKSGKSSPAKGSASAKTKKK